MDAVSVGSNQSITPLSCPNCCLSHLATIASDLEWLLLQKLSYHGIYVECASASWNQKPRVSYYADIIADSTAWPIACKLAQTGRLSQTGTKQSRTKKMAKSCNMSSIIDSYTYYQYITQADRQTGTTYQVTPNKDGAPSDRRVRIERRPETCPTQPETVRLSRLSVLYRYGTIGLPVACSALGDRQTELPAESRPRMAFDRFQTQESSSEDTFRYFEACWMISKTAGKPCSANQAARVHQVDPEWKL